MKKTPVKMNIDLSVVVFKEGTSYVAYSPALDLSTSAKTDKKARQRFSEAVRLFFEELAELGTTQEVLASLGWKKVRSNWKPPMVVSNYVQPMTLFRA